MAMTYDSVEKMAHVWLNYTSKNEKDNRRMSVARQTWSMQDWEECPMLDSDFQRMFTDRGGSVPYIKDIFDMACSLHPYSIIVYTNSDICCHSQCSQRIRSAMQNASACYSRRRDFFHSFDYPIPDELIERGSAQPGIDLFAFRPAWWLLYKDTYPDMLCGRMAWDAIMTLTIERTNPGASSTLHNIIYHEDHPSVWNRPHNIKSLPSQQYVAGLGLEWCALNNEDPNFLGMP